MTEKWVKVGEERLTETQGLNSRGAGVFEAQENMALCGWEMQTETEEKRIRALRGREREGGGSIESTELTLNEQNQREELPLSRLPNTLQTPTQLLLFEVVGAINTCS